MAIQCEFINFIIPISKINLVYQGGFKQFKKDHIMGFSGRHSHNDFLFRDGAMNPIDIQNLVNKWENMGLKGVVKIYRQNNGWTFV